MAQANHEGITELQDIVLTLIYSEGISLDAEIERVMTADELLTQLGRFLHDPREMSAFVLSAAIRSVLA